MVESIENPSSNQILNMLKHVAIGGSICFASMFFLRLLIVGIIYILLDRFNCVGVRIFNEALLAMTLILLGTAYIPAGFCGGIYLGYKVKKNLRAVLLFSALIGCVILFLIMHLFGFIITYKIEVEQEIIIPIFTPLLGVIVGTYLGGYSVEWEKLEREIPPEAGFKETLKEVPKGLRLTEIKGIGPRRAERLGDVGIITIKDLAKASPKNLSERTGIPEKTLSKLIEDAKRRLEEAETK
mgnify:CR=1 FL=1